MLFYIVVLLEEPVESSKVGASGETAESDLLEFSKFDINRVLKHGERLVGSSGAEYDLPDEDLIGTYSILFFNFSRSILLMALRECVMQLSKVF